MLPGQPLLTDAVKKVLAGYPDLKLPLLRSELRKHPQLGTVSRQSAVELFPDAGDPECAFGGLLLILGGWEESHEVVQNVTGVNGSYWHAIAHRIEPDLANSGYWFRRVALHPVFESLRQGALDLVSAQRETRWEIPDTWNPSAFADFCGRAASGTGGAHYHLAVAIQSLEWRLLFEYCAAPHAGPL